MSSQQYKNIGKKQIINVMTQMIQKIEAIEMTLNIAIEFIDKDKTFDAFMKEKLGGKNETSGDGETDTKRNTPKSNKD